MEEDFNTSDGLMLEMQGFSAQPFRSELPGRAMQVAALVLLSDPAERARSRGAALAALYALTPTETRIADLLFQGTEIAGIANSLEIAEGTVRFHMKRVLAKTGAHRQVEPVRLMAALPGV